MSTVSNSPAETIDVPQRHRFDTAALSRYMQRHVEGFVPPLRVRQFAGGVSNPTYFIEGATRRYVLRKKPAGELQASAHAVDREYRVMTALGQTDVPVARTICLCEDEAVIGQAFYLMDYVAGRVIRDPAIPGASPAERTAIYRSLAETQARLHRVDHVAIGLADYGRPGNYFQRQIARWSRQYEDAKTRDVRELAQLKEWLLARIPAREESAISHGDFRIENMIMHPVEPRVVAILDWELSTIGHPLADLGSSVAFYYLAPGTPTGFREPLDLAAAGIIGVDEFVQEYCRHRGLEGIPNFNFFVIFALFRLASSMAGIAKRGATGIASSPDAARWGDYIEPTAEVAWRLAQSE